MARDRGEVMTSAAALRDVTLRPAEAGDARMIFEWRNLPTIIARATSGRPVTWEEHTAWFARTLASGATRMFIVCRAGEPVGQVRFDRRDAESAVISVYLIESHTNRGSGTTAIRAGSARAFAELGVRRIVACVQLDNARGERSFLKCGFVKVDGRGWCPPGHMTLVLEKGP
jgi:RimJ/RimL family protein N-acetyltransferase